MKLTQKQLGELAKVSTPTISRFEQVDKDIQMSSVLSILDVFGMTDKRTLAFRHEESKYDSGREAMAFWGEEAGRPVVCRISREALDDHFSDRDRLRPEAAFAKHRKEIESLARRKYILDQVEPDGSILIGTLEIA